MRRILAVISGAFLLASCTTNPTSGQSMFSVVSPQQENSIGAGQHADILKQFNGVNDNDKLNEFVAMIGVRLVPAAERKDVRWTFTVLDDDAVNAFAVPGGYVYVTRGLLNLAQDESQVAAVIAHEMGHINARHSAQQMSQGMLAQIGLQALDIATGSNAASQIGGVGAQAFLMKYSRTHEFEADALSVRYLTAAGYDPYAAEKFLTLLQENTQLEARMAGNPDTAQFNFMSTHPMTPDRIVRARVLADQTAKVGTPIIDRSGYLKAIDGTVYGDAAEQGFVRGNEFIHPNLKIRFEVPSGFHIKNGAKQVVAENNAGAAIVFDSVRTNTADPAAFIAQWASGSPLSGQERITVNGIAGATASTQVNTSKGARDAQLVALSAGGGGEFYRLVYLAPVGQMANYASVFRTSTYSFAHDDSLQRVSPNRVRVITVRAGDTPQSLAAKMPVQDYAVERFCLLNNITPQTRLEPGTQVKTVQ